MYCDYFGFKEKPFQITPNPRFLYLSRNHREAFAHLLYGINAHGGFIGLTGEVGTGKTTVLRTLLEQLDDSTHRTALILNPCLSAIELLRSINREFGIPHDGLKNGALLEALNQFLLTENREGRTVVLVIDEAQNLAPQVLEQIRLISNLETDTDKLIQIVLAGQPELNSLLEKQELRQLSQRITVRYHLLPMDYSDSASYIQHRLEVAGARGKVEFSPAAMKRIFDFAKGSPRLINLACDRALLVAYGEDTREITAAIAATAIAELRTSRSPVSRRGRIILAAAIVLCLAFMAIITFSPADSLVSGKNSGHTPENTPQPAKKPPPLPTSATRSQPPQWEKLPESPYLAVNAILRLWGDEGLDESKRGRTAASLFRSRKFSTIAVTSLRDVVMLDTPAIMEIAAQDGKTRFIALLSSDGQTFRIAPEFGGVGTISMGELASVWTGRGRIAWRNSQIVQMNLYADAENEDVLKLQRLLAGAGLLKGKLSGRLDNATMGAIKMLQKSAGLNPDGIPGDKTLLVLYRNHGKAPSPRLSTAGGRQT